jgi:DNA repair exonuclease SbcCD ATPase subunit
MASRKAQIQIQTTADTSGAQAAAKAIQQVDTASTQAAGGASKVGQTAAQAGFQLQDFAVQVGGGTSALTAFAQQAPQLLGAFGPSGAIAGALIAVGAVATKIFMDMAADAEEAGKSAEEMAEKLSDAFKAAGSAEAKEATAVFQHQRELTNALAASALALKSIQEDRIQLDIQQAKGQASLTTEALKYLEATGQITNAEQAIATVRKQALEQERALQVEKVQQEVQRKVNEYQLIAEQRNRAAQDVRDAENRVTELQTQQAELTRQLNMRRESDKTLEARGFAPGPSAETLALEGELQALAIQIEAFQNVVKETPARLRELTQASFEAAASVDMAAAEAQNQIESINQQFNFQQRAEAIKTATEAVVSGSKEIAQTVERFQPVSEAQAQTKAQLLAVLENGIENQTEQQQVAAQLQALMANLGVGQNITRQNLQELIKINNDLASRMNDANREIQSLKVKVNGMMAITR